MFHHVYAAHHPTRREESSRVITMLHNRACYITEPGFGAVLGGPWAVPERGLFVYPE